MTGDSPQALIGDLTESDAALFFSTRRAQGFNTVWINLLCNAYTGCRQDGETWDGIPPFTTPGDLSTPNEAYFARADRMIQLAAQYGFVVLLDPAETGGWLDTMIANGVEKDRAYGQYLGRRYGGFSNIIWMSGNDYQTGVRRNDPYVTAVAQGIRDTDPSALQTVELNYLTSGSLDDPAWAPLIDLNASYTYDPTYVQVLKDYNRSNFLPTFLVEAQLRGRAERAASPRGHRNSSGGRNTGRCSAAPRASCSGTTTPGSSSARSGTPTATASAAGRTSSLAGRDADGERRGAVFLPAVVSTRTRPGSPGRHERVRVVRRRRLRDGRPHARRKARDGVRAVGPHDHGRSREAQRSGHRSLVRPDKRGVQADRRRAARQQRQPSRSRRRVPTPRAQGDWVLVLEAQ